MTIKDLINDALTNYLYKINLLAMDYKKSHAEDYTLYFFKRPNQRTKDFCDELSDLLSNLSPELINYEKLEKDSTYKSKIGKIILDLESDLEWFERAPHIDEKTKAFCSSRIQMGKHQTSSGSYYFSRWQTHYCAGRRSFS